MLSHALTIFFFFEKEFTSTRSIINLNCSSHRHKTIEIYMIFYIFVIHVIVKHICITSDGLLLSILLLHSLIIGKTVSSMQGAGGHGSGY